MGTPLVIPFAKKPLCALVLLSPVTQGGEVDKWGKWREPGGFCRMVVAVHGGIKVSPVNGACAHPKCSCRDKGCVDLLEENVSIPGWSTWKRVCWRACMEWFEVVLPELMFPGIAVLRLTCACTGLI